MENVHKQSGRYDSIGLQIAFDEQKDSFVIGLQGDFVLARFKEYYQSEGQVPGNFTKLNTKI